MGFGEGLCGREREREKELHRELSIQGPKEWPTVCSFYGVIGVYRFQGVGTVENQLEEAMEHKKQSGFMYIYIYGFYSGDY